MDARRWCCLLLVLVAGCVGPAVDGDGASTAADRTTATVQRVVDGDTLDVRLADGSETRVRLLGVDTPEVHAATDPAEYEGVPETDAGRACLRRWGERASAFATDRLASRTVTVSVDPTADRRDRYDRLLAYVLVDGDSFNYRLVATGHARLYDTTFRERERYAAAEARAREENRGLWACREPTRASDELLVRVHADAAGDDHENLDDEYVVLTNGRNRTLDLGGWTVSDAAGHTYTFPEGATLAPDATLYLYTGAGEDGDGAYYWGSDGAVWNNGGDEVTVRNASGAVVARHAY
jgi:micrococcal nuclease